MRKTRNGMLHPTAFAELYKIICEIQIIHYFSIPVIHNSSFAVTSVTQYFTACSFQKQLLCYMRIKHWSLVHIIYFQIAEVVNSALDEYFPDPELVRVIAEPGRFYVASAFILATNIHSKREVPNGKDVSHIMYYINDGVYGSFNSLLYDHSQVTPIPLNVSYSLVTFCSVTVWSSLLSRMEMWVDWLRMDMIFINACDTY